MVELSRPSSRQNTSRTPVEVNSPERSSSNVGVGIRKSVNVNYVKKPPLTFLLKKDWSTFVSCLQGANRHEYQHSRKRSRRLLHAYKSLYYEYCYVCDNMIVNEKCGDNLKLLQNNNIEGLEGITPHIEESESQLYQNNIQPASTLRQRIVPLMKKTLYFFPDKYTKPYDLIRRPVKAPLKIYGRKRVREMRAFKCFYSNDQGNSPSCVQVPIALELLMPRIQEKITRIMLKCPFLRDPLEVAAELKQCNYEVNACVKHFRNTKSIRDIIDEVLPPPNQSSADFERNWLKIPLVINNSKCRNQEEIVDSSAIGDAGNITYQISDRQQTNRSIDAKSSSLAEIQSTGTHIVTAKGESPKNAGLSGNSEYDVKLENGMNTPTAKGESPKNAGLSDNSEFEAELGNGTNTLSNLSDGHSFHNLASNDLDGIVTRFDNDSVYNMMKCLVDIKLTQENIKHDINHMINSFNIEMEAFSNNLSATFGIIGKQSAGHDNYVEMHQLKQYVAELQKKCRQEEKRRKHVYNLMQEQLGNVRVCCRCRDVDDSKTLLEIGNDRITTTAYPKEEFRFDKVFSSEYSQSKIYEELKPLVTSFIDGYNVCFITYGGEATGKTFTLLGNGEPGKEGIIQRSLDTVLKEKINRQNDWDLNLSASLIEIYNDQYSDFFDGRQHINLRIEQGLDDVFNCLKRVPLNSEADVKALVQICCRRRKVAATALNPSSSRSHLIALIRLDGKSKIYGDQFRSYMALCDLAGFEDIAKAETQSNAKLSQEASYINRSLTAFNRVFVALRKQDPKTVPYRDSKLTYFLKPFLINSGKCCLIITVRGDKKSLNSTTTTLRFGRETRSVTLGKAKRQIHFDRYM